MRRAAASSATAVVMSRPQGGPYTQWQRAAKLLLAQSNVAALSKSVKLALFYDAKLDVTAMA